MKTFIYIARNFFRRTVLLLSIVILPAWAIGQQVIGPMTVVLKPPYSSNYAAYENLTNHAIITLVGGPRALDIVLYGKLINLQSDWMIATRENYQGGKFTLGVNQTKVIINDVSSLLFLNRNNVDHSGVPDEVWSEILKTGQLPEGPYSFCVEAYYYD
ncbi:MAG: hypothetical protein JSS80_11565, partial [Bacteroidetes bacterium]|nr:hypothetical protein [Bacteroidota bacterium]